MEEDDVYVSQLRDVYESCDLTGKGYLNRSELIDLCQRLQLDDHIPALLTECIGDEVSDGKVEFEIFKDAFVAVLSKTIDSMAETTEDDRSEMSEIIELEPEPTKVFNNKKYGRTTQPADFSLYDEGVHSDKEIEKTKMESQETPKSSKALARRQSSKRLSRKLSKRNSLQRKLSTPLDQKTLIGKEEILEGSGAMDYSLNIQNDNDDAMTVDEVNQLKEIWDELSVGVSGYLDMHELSIVCEHIGMDNIEDQELELLFKELDANEDGLVSFDEFLNGLFLVTKQQTTSNDMDMTDSPIIPISKNDLALESTPQPSHPQSSGLMPRHSGRKSSILDESSNFKKVDLLSFLDQNNTGWVRADIVEDYFNTIAPEDVKLTLKKLQPNAEGEIKISEVTKVLQNMILEKGDGVSMAVLQAYSQEINHLRGELESLASERDKLKGNLSKYGFDNTMLIRESEEQTRELERQYEKKLDNQDKTFVGKLQQKEVEWQSEHSLMQKSFLTQKNDLEDQLKASKLEENKLKDKLMEAEAEIERLQQHVTEATDDLLEEQKKSSRLAKELNSTSDLQHRLVELEASRELLKDQYTSQARTVGELEQIKKELRDENDELQVQLENLKAQLNTMGKRKHRRRHGKGDDESASERSRGKSHRSSKSSTPKVSKTGSYLSDYTKPVVIKRNEDGETTDDEDDDEMQGVNYDDELGSLELKKKVADQELIIERLREDLESVHKMLEGDVGEARLKYERNLLEYEEKQREELAEIQTQFDIERKDLIDDYETKLRNLEEANAKEKEAIVQGFIREKEDIMNHSESDRDEVREFHNSEKKKLENIFKQEKVEADMKFKSKKTKLQEQIVILETEKAEIELKFVNDKAEMEQQFRIRLNELETKYEKAVKDLDAARKEIALLKEELSKRSKSNDYEIERKWRNEISRLETEKTEMQMNFLNEKTDLEQQYRVRILELEQKLASASRDYEQSQIDVSLLKDEMDTNYKGNLNELERKWKAEKAQCEKEKSEMELRFINETAEIEQRYRISLSENEQKLSSASRELERSKKEIELLKDELNAKYKGDMDDLERKWKNERQQLIDDFGYEKEDMGRIHKREIADLTKSFNAQLTDQERHFAKEILVVKEESKREKTEAEQKHQKSKRDLMNNLEQQHQNELAERLSEAKKIALEEKTGLEKQLKDQKRQLSQDLNKEKTNFETELQRVKTEIQIALTEEKAQLEEEHIVEKIQLEERYKAEMAEMEEEFKENEIKLEEKIRSDFENIMESHRIEVEENYQEEKTELLESFAREKAELELSWQIEKAELEENFDTEKADLEEMLIKEKEDLGRKFARQKEKTEIEHKEKINELKNKLENDMNTKFGRETKLLQKTVEHLENELNALKEQKKELETKMQSLELKQISQNQEAVEIEEFKRDKTAMLNKIEVLEKELKKLHAEKKELQNHKDDLERDRATILENSVKEITDQHEQLFKLQAERNNLDLQVITLRKIEKEAEEFKHENMKLKKQTMECQKEISDLEKVRLELSTLENTARKLEARNRSLETGIQESEIKSSRLEADARHLQEKLENMESIHKKEMEAQKDRLNLSTTAAATEKSRYIREIQEIREQLNRATVASERDQALKAKVFNDAKAEVINLNKKLEERSRHIKDIEHREKTWQTRMDEVIQAKKDLESQLKQAKECLQENNEKYSKSKYAMDVKTTRSDTLVQELYIENADLSKQLQQADITKRKVEKQVRQLTEQKKALQRVISKLCGANSMA